MWAEASVGATTRQVGAYFDLVYAAFHHNWSEQYLVLLDPPVGDVHALLLQDPDYNDPPVELSYLGETMNVLRSSPLSSYSEEEQQD